MNPHQLLSKEHEKAVDALSQATRNREILEGQLEAARLVEQQAGEHAKGYEDALRALEATQ